MATAQSVVTAYNVTLAAAEALTGSCDTAYELAHGAKSNYGRAGNKPIADKVQGIIDAINEVTRRTHLIDDELPLFRQVVESLPGATDDEVMIETADVVLDILGEKTPILAGPLIEARATANSTVTKTAPGLIVALTKAVPLAEAAQRAISALRTTTTAYKNTVTAPTAG